MTSIRSFLWIGFQLLFCNTSFKHFILLCGAFQLIYLCTWSVKSVCWVWNAGSSTLSHVPWKQFWHFLFYLPRCSLCNLRSRQSFWSDDDSQQNQLSKQTCSLLLMNSTSFWEWKAQTRLLWTKPWWLGAALAISERHHSGHCAHPVMSKSQKRRRACAAIQNHMGRDQPLLYPGLRETYTHSLSCLFFFFLFLQVRLGESLCFIINHDYLLKASSN